MGLDQYLKMGIYYSTSDWSKNKETTKKIQELLPITKNARHGIDIRFCIGYWRKANHIHQWFLDNVYTVPDECQDIYVEKEQLDELIRLCRKIIKVWDDPEQLEDLIPKMSIYFIGEADHFKKWYKYDVFYTIMLLHKAVKLQQQYKKNGLWPEFYYQSSW